MNLKLDLLIFFRLCIVILCLNYTLKAEDPLKISLVSDQDSIKANSTFTVAIHQKIEKNYHTYYFNPGKVGLETSIKWDLPKGFEAGPIKWPTPIESTMSDYTIWGYENEALLLVDIKAPKDLSGKDHINLMGKVIYMCCYKTCHPGSQKVSISLPISHEPNKNKWAHAFQKVRDEQPKEDLNWKFKCTQKGNQYFVELIYLNHQRVPHFDYLKLFTDKRMIDSNIKPTQHLEKNKITLTYQVEKYLGERPKTLDGRLIFKNKNITKSILFSTPILQSF